MFKSISEYQVNHLKKKVEKLNKKAKKLNLQEMEIIISKPYLIDNINSNSVLNEKIEVYDVDIIGETPIIKNWRFIGKITGYPNGSNIIEKSPFVENESDLSEFRNIKSVCHHCNTTRYRKHTYIVENIETKKMITVGSTCIKDFLGHSAPALNFHVNKMLNIFNEDLSEITGFKKSFYDVKKILNIASDIILTKGYMSIKKYNETFGSMDEKIPSPTVEVLKYHLNDKNFKYDPSDKAIKLTKNVIKWGQNFDQNKKKNDYFYNLSVIFENGLCKGKQFGLLISAINTYQIENKETKKFGISEFVGKIGEKIEIENVTINNMILLDTEYGLARMVLMSDENGNKLVWYSSSKKQEFNENSVIKLKGTIKTHKEYKGVKQTVLTRCKIEY